MTHVPSTIELYYDGTDISSVVMFRDCVFETQASAQPGTFSMRVRDVDRTLSFTTGKEIKLVLDGVTMFGGFVTTVARTFAFPAVDTTDINQVTRIWVLRGVDYNILFDKLFPFDQSDPLAELGSLPMGTTDDVIINTLCTNYLSLPGDLDFTTLVESVGSPANETEFVWVERGQTWRRQMDEISRGSGSLYYINGDKQLVNKAYEDAEARWGFSDVPNFRERTLYSGDQMFQGLFVGPRELDIAEDGTQIVNDALVWGGSAFATETGSVVFGRSTNPTSITEHNRWQYAEVRVNDPLYLTQGQVDNRAELIVSGLPGSDARGISRGLQNPQWNVSLSWFGHDVPTVASVPNHLTPGALVTMYWYALGSGGVPLITILPLRSMRISFVTLSATDGRPFPRFDGTFSLSPTDPWALWAYLLSNRDRLRSFQSANAFAAVNSTNPAFTQATLSPSPNGLITSFTTPSSFRAGTTQVFINSLVQRRGIDYTETTPNIIVFAQPPRSTDALWITYAVQ